MCGGGGLQFYIFFFIIFFSFCRTLALNICKFSLPCYVVFAAALLHNSYDE